MSETEYLAISGKVKKLTDRAALLFLPEYLEDKWVPLSLIENGNDLEESDEVQDLLIAEWFCDKEGIS